MPRSTAIGLVIPLSMRHKWVGGRRINRAQRATAPGRAAWARVDPRAPKMSRSVIGFPSVSLYGVAMSWRVRGCWPLGKALQHLPRQQAQNRRDAMIPRRFGGGAYEGRMSDRGSRR